MRGRSAILCFIILFQFTCFPQDILPHSSEKFRTAQRVYDDIIRAAGDARTPPHLELRPAGVSGNQNVAWYDPAANRITLDEQAYDLCSSVGRDSLNALAALLGHELAHFFKDHSWRGDFGNAFADRDVGQAVSRSDASREQVIAYETQADEFGGIIGCMAGYTTLGIASRILPLVYTSYNLAPRLRGYPSLDDRIAIARRSEEKLKSFSLLFESARSLLLLKKYEPAATFLDAVAQAFPSREVLNNAGVSRALAALDMFGRDEVRFAYPLELDALSRLRAPQSRGQRDSIVVRRRSDLLEQAVRKLDEARVRDANYAPALVNLACVYDLLGENDLAAAYCSRAMSLAQRLKDSTTYALALTARGIHHAKNGQSEKALEDFSLAQAGVPVPASFNLDELRHPGQRMMEKPRMKGKRERVAGFTPRQAAAQLLPIRSICLPLNDCGATGYASGSVTQAARIDVKEADTWTSTMITVSGKTIVLLSTEANYAGGTDRGVGFGDSPEDVERMYGKPSYVLSDTKGASMMYHDEGIVVHVDHQGKVAGWTLFQEE